MASLAIAFMRTAALVDLVRVADPEGTKFVRILSDTKIGIGSDALSPSIVIDFLAETTAGPSEALEPKKAPIVAPTSSPAVQVMPPDAPSGALSWKDRLTKNWFELQGKKTRCSSVKEILLRGLQAIETERPGTLEKLSQIKKRTKRIVARDRNSLFESPHLVQDHSSQIPSRWWVGTNNSSQEVKSWLRQAVECAGLRWDADFKCSI